MGERSDAELLLAFQREGDYEAFEELFGRQDRMQQIREAMRLRRRTSDRQLAMDTRAVESFCERFPESRRIRNAI